MTSTTDQIKNDFVDGLSRMSQFWGFPRGMGAIFAVLYLSPGPLSLDELVTRSGLTKGAISTNVRTLARLGLIRPISRLADRKDYYEAETDFYKAIRSILKERKNNDFDRAVSSVKAALLELEDGAGSMDDSERAFLIDRLQALQSFFDALDNLTVAVTRLDSLGTNTVQSVLKILK
jgi:HTH-type transcriptional regulator, glycine betaine synthesis regulator